MNTIVFNKLSGAVLFEDRGAPEREWGSRPYGGVLDSTHARPEVGIPDHPPLKDNLSLRHRTTGARQNGGKVRHKRQALQDMARPLKQWLYKHRDNPYPTKTEKILLALGSQMTLVQVTAGDAPARVLSVRHRHMTPATTRPFQRQTPRKEYSRSEVVRPPSPPHLSPGARGGRVCGAGALQSGTRARRPFPGGWGARGCGEKVSGRGESRGQGPGGTAHPGLPLSPRPGPGRMAGR
uniref:KN homeodomain domain-containing protein n=1 Tax=Ailuropoda melanoleuca TaxID=9646 RepID=A0A7N5J9S5_AILME